MKNLKVLDVTLRDGGCVNNFDFGQNYMEKILSAQEASGVDIIELGYIDEKKGSVSGRTQYISEQVITESFLKNKKLNKKNKDGKKYKRNSDEDKKNNNDSGKLKKE